MPIPIHKPAPDGAAVRPLRVPSAPTVPAAPVPQGLVGPVGLTLCGEGLPV